MLKSALFLAAMIGAAPAFACQTTSAKVDGLIGGSSFRNGICSVTVIIEKVTLPSMCRLNLRPTEDGVEVITGLSEKNCPQDEGPVHGIITSMGDRLYFTSGTIDLKNAGTVK